MQIIEKLAHPANFRSGSGTREINILVIHTMEGTAVGTAAWFGRDHSPASPSSAHYGISKKGEIFRFVAEDDIAFHAGNREINATSIGIELEGTCEDKGNFTAPMIEALIELTKDLCSRKGVPRSRVTILGHCDVPDTRPGHKGQTGGAGHHRDPGPFFPWKAYLERLVDNGTE